MHKMYACRSKFNCCSYFIGQEEETIKSYGDIKVTPFNLKEEMEEGHFDAEGDYERHF